MQECRNAGMQECTNACSGVAVYFSRRRRAELERTCHMRAQGLTTLCVLALVIAIGLVTPVAVEGQAQAPSNKNQTSTSKKTTAAGKTAKTWAQPRTPWGDPDLQGITWNYATIT